MGYFNHEAMFVLSLSPAMRDKLTDVVEEVVQLRSSGLTTEEIEKMLENDLELIEKSSSTPRMVRHIALGTSLATGN